MKKTLLLIALLPTLLWAQGTDSAETVLRRFTTMLNHEALPRDSMLVLETTVSYPGSADTFVMRRWYLPDSMLRIEVWRGDSLTYGLCTNGTTRHREYSARMGWWRDLFADEFNRKIQAYDFRGPLHYWYDDETHFTYAGTITFKGHPMRVVRAERQKSNIRYFLFESGSGLLTMVVNADHLPGGDLAAADEHSDWSAYHEYLPLGESLIASEQSYLHNGLLTVMRTTARFEKPNKLIFNKDTPE